MRDRRQSRRGGDGDRTQRSAGTRRTVRSVSVRSVLPTAGRLCVRSFRTRGTGILACPGFVAVYKSRQTRMSVLLISFGFRLWAHGDEQREPQTVVNKFGVAQRERLLEMRGFAVNGKALEFLMRFHEERSAGSFVGAARFHADEAVFDEVGAADAMLCGDFVQRVEQVDGAKF